MVLSELMQSMFVVFSSCFAYLDFLFHRVVFSLSLSLCVCVCVFYIFVGGNWARSRRKYYG